MSKGIALVTGGTKGIGKALCLLLKDAGYQVFSASRSKSLPQGMDGITQISVDFSNSEETRSFAEKFLADFGAPVVLINNAGYGAFYEWGKFPEEEINLQVQVLFSSPVELCRIFAPAMAEQSRGVIVNLSSLATLYPLPFMPLYNAGKAALSSFSQTLMLEYIHSPAIIDFRMGNVRTDFNCSASKQGNHSEKMTSTWTQIDEQLQASILPDRAAQQIFSRIQSAKSGTYFGGGCFHVLFLPFVDRFLPTKLKNYLIRFWYK
jgi:NAD(P)-dependent dehydrogenase (short-subunit alcohol dehydrogenase family)